MIGVADKVGTLKPGLAFDVIVAAGNPLGDLSRLEDVRLVMLGRDISATRAA